MMHHHHPPPHHFQQPPRHLPPPPPPPPPPEVLEVGQESGAARCYFCGKLIREQDVQKTKHQVGHGYEIFALICPACRQQKERGEGPFRPRIPWAGVVAVLVFLGFGLFVLSQFGGLPSLGGLGPSNSPNALTLRVDRVEQQGGNFRVWMTATNHTSDQLTLPLFGYFFVTDDLGNQYTADPFSSTFPRDVAPGATVSGYANMKEPLNGGASRLRAEFTTVFGSFRVKSARVEGVPVR